MNVELIDVNEADINNVFKKPKDLIESIIKYIKENLDTFCTPTKNIPKEKINFTYNTIKLNEYPNDYISIEIQGIYQKGIIIKVLANSSRGIYNYDTITSGLLIINEDKTPMFIIDQIDGRKEQNMNIAKITTPTLFIKTNQNIITEEIKALGKRIDQKKVLIIKNNIHYNEKKYHQKIEILKLKFKLLIIKYLEKLEQSKEENITSTKIKRKRSFRNNSN